MTRQSMLECIMVEQRQRKLYGMTDEQSVLAHAALDALVDGQSLFGIGGGWNSLPGFERRLDALVALLRSDEPIPKALRSALADALDPEVDAPIKLRAQDTKQPSLLTVLRWHENSRRVLAVYDAVREANPALGNVDALDQAAGEVGVSSSEAGRMLADAYADREQSAILSAGFASGQGFAENLAALRQQQNAPRKRGPKPRKR